MYIFLRFLILLHPIKDINDNVYKKGIKEESKDGRKQEKEVKVT